MVLPISCNECRRRKIRCDRIQPCQNCTNKSIPCTYPSKFRSIDLNKFKPKSSQDETVTAVEFYKRKIQDLETKLAISEDLISIFDSDGSSITKYFGQNSLSVLECETMNGILPFEKNVTKAVNLKKKPLPELIADDPVKNQRMIKKLVKSFFDGNIYYYFNEMVDKDDLMNFLNDYDRIENWNNDEDIMLLCCILVDTLKSCLENRAESIISNQPQVVRSLISYYFQISKIQTTESEKFIQSQLILSNYYYYTYAFEKCWKLIFQLVSNAYSLGMHIQGGPLWTKINTMESLMCSSSSRPNIINEQVMNPKLQLDDELNEYKFSEILRSKNGLYVSSYVQKTTISYEDVLQLDAKFDEYNNYLYSKTIWRNKSGEEIGVEEFKRNEKICILLVMTLSTQLKLHFDHFEEQKYSDIKMMKLLKEYLELLGGFVYGKLNTLRDKFAALECFFYQFLLIFLKYLNYKSVSIMMKSVTMDSTSTIRLESTNSSNAEILEITDLQKTLTDIYGECTLTNNRITKVIDIIKSVNLGEIKTEDFVGDKNGDYYYATDELKDILEDPVYDALRSVTEFRPESSNYY